MPYLRPHELLAPVQRERRNDDGGYPSCPEEVVRRDVVHNQPERQGSVPDRMQLQDSRIRAGKDPLRHSKIEVLAASFLLNA